MHKSILVLYMETLCELIMRTVIHCDVLIVIVSFSFLCCFMTFCCPCYCLNFSLPIPLRLYTSRYWSNPLFLIFDIQALRTECQKVKNGGLDQYGTEPFEQQ